ncbi:MAG: rod shape-determining protein MreD [Fidelibacterota bacterium]
MKWNKLFLLAALVFLAQFFLTGFMTVKMIRPDFIVILVFYISLKYGRLPAVIMGFILGFLVDMTGVGSYFGLSALTCSITGYLGGFLRGKYERYVPYIFHLSWIGIIALHFLIYTYIRFQVVFTTDMGLFWLKWLLSFSYTFIFILVLNYFYPLKEASRA